MTVHGIVTPSRSIGGSASDTLNAAVRAVVASGRVVVAAAGNASQRCRDCSSSALVCSLPFEDGCPTGRQCRGQLHGKIVQSFRFSDSDIHTSSSTWSELPHSRGHQGMQQGSRYRQDGETEEQAGRAEGGAPTHTLSPLVQRLQ